jgi:hypothetical protein
MAAICPVDLSDGLTGPTPVCGDLRVGHGRIAVEAEDPAGEVVLEDRAGRGDQVVAAASLGQEGETVEDLRLGQGGGEQAGDRLCREPVEHPGFRSGAHQLRDDVGVEDDHPSNATGSRAGSRGLSGRSTPPRAAKRSWIA